ncbi:MAG: hypothetical protein HYZ57_06580 [Acidobacteria bacterium]|nr:hypothetical protein [Acidobacteriota bacterium]
MGARFAERRMEGSAAGTTEGLLLGLPANDVVDGLHEDIDLFGEVLDLGAELIMRLLHVLRELVGDPRKLINAVGQDNLRLEKEFVFLLHIGLDVGQDLDDAFEAIEARMVVPVAVLHEIPPV